MTNYKVRTSTWKAYTHTEVGQMIAGNETKQCNCIIMMKVTVV